MHLGLSCQLTNVSLTQVNDNGKPVGDPLSGVFESTLIVVDVNDEFPVFILPLDDETSYWVDEVNKKKPSTQKVPINIAVDIKVFLSPISIGKM